MFNSVYSAPVTSTEFMLMALCALLGGIVFAWIMSYRVVSTRRFFVVTSILPFIVGSVITFVNGNIGAGVAIGGAFGLIRFRSAPGSADEISAILISMGAGIAFGMGYVAYGILILLALALVYFALSSTGLFEHSCKASERLLKITVPETLEYSGEFDDIFARYLKKHDQVGVKTTGMGSMFRLSYRIMMKDDAQEKAFIDELRTKNGNLEISVLPYTNDANQL